MEPSVPSKLGEYTVARLKRVGKLPPPGEGVGHNHSNVAKKTRSKIAAFLGLIYYRARLIFMTGSPKFFISYSQKDSKFREELEDHLRAASFAGDQLLWWSDARLTDGGDWQKELETELESSTGAVLLVSKDFLTSKFIQDHELPFFFEQAKQGYPVLWVLVSDCNWEYTAVAQYQNLLGSKKPLNSMGPPARQMNWKKLVKSMRERVDESVSVAHYFEIEASRDITLHSNRLIDALANYQPKNPMVSPEDLRWHADRCGRLLGGKEPLRLPWNIPEPGIEWAKAIWDFLNQPANSDCMKDWQSFERNCARLYPRFRDAHLAVILRVWEHSKPLPSDPHADRYHIKRILRSLLRKNPPFVQLLEKLGSYSYPSQSQAAFTKLADSLKLISVAHIAVLLEAEHFGFNEQGEVGFEALDRSGQLCERICHWLLQAHHTVRSVLPEETPIPS